MTGLLNPKSSGKIRRPLFFFMIFVVFLVSRPWDFSSGLHAAVLFFSLNQFYGREVLTSQIEEPQKKCDASLS